MHSLALRAPVDPEEASRRLAGRPGLAWLDAGTAATPAGWSFVGADPVAKIDARWGEGSPLVALDALEGNVEPAQPQGPGPRPEDVPRWVGFVAYDAAWSRRPVRLERRAGSRVVSFLRYDALFAFDHASGHAYLVGDDRRACERLARALEAPATRPARARIGALRADAPARHLAAIEACLEHIRRGDVYQVNLARRWQGTFDGDSLALFLAMRRASPVPLGFYLDDGERVIASRTMERFLSWERSSGRLETRPIKGTLARAGAHDADETRTLTTDPKERAEHVMIVDLMRNDLGRVARTGSVEVAELMKSEPYARLHHLVSTVRCTTRPEVGLRAILDATFPPGSVTGTPKLRAIEIIEALEAHARGVYTGALGFVDRTGGLSLAVAIRTAVTCAGQVDYWAGGGIVEASRPERELAETELKARAFLDAVEALESDDARALSPAAPVR